MEEPTQEVSREQMAREVRRWVISRATETLRAALRSTAYPSLRDEAKDLLAALAWAEENLSDSDWLALAGRADDLGWIRQYARILYPDHVVSFPV